MTRMSESIIKSQKVAPISLETPDDQLCKKRGAFLPGRKVLIPTLLQLHIACYIALHPPPVWHSRLAAFWQPFLLTPSVQGEVFIDQTIGVIYTYDQANKLSISTDDIDQDMAMGLQKFLREKNKKLLKVTTPSWVYLTLPHTGGPA